MITLADFKKIPYGEIFRSGVVIDDPTRINIFQSGQRIKWIAMKGGGNDWTIYADFEGNSDKIICQLGRKVTNKDVVRKLIECDQEVMDRYRF